ncbi:hypothetical protein [Microtetraspora niveoalba]|uniref:hypothetical protein n=1 Tax=Microtetraspora niveoalba TaxID=46175 RepID=UPI0012FB870D|nr:hypothetical protein [Microtetraspora niveoalba]
MRWFRRRIRPLPRARTPLDVVPGLVARAEAGHPHAFHDLCEGLLGAAAEPTCAGRALDALTASRPTLWLDLDLALRAPWYDYMRPARRPGTSRGWEPGTTLDVALRASSHDGYEREQAVRHDAMRTDFRLLPVLVIRAADWVDEVRIAALETLRLVLADPAADLLAALPIAVRLGDRRRGGPALAEVRAALLRADDGTSARARGCADPRARRFAYRVSLDSGRLRETDLMAAALGESDAVSRVWCAEAVGRMDRPDLLERLLTGRSARVRAVALTGLVRLGRPEHGARFLDDRSTVVRLTAQWAVRRAGGDPAQTCRALLAARPGARVAGLIAGLGDCGGGGDAGLVRPYLADPRPAVRAEAVRALLRLGAPVDLIPMLGDPAPAVVWRAVTGLRRSGVPADRLWPLLGPGLPRHVRQAAHRLLTGVDTWTRLKADLTLMGDTDESLRRRARADLVMWRADGAATMYTSPPRQLADELAALIDAAEASLGQREAAELRWFLSVGG